MSNQNGDQWHILRHAESVLEAFPPEKLVMLSPDAEEPLPCVEEGKVYVVGGIVDKEIKKQRTLEKATANDVSAHTCSFNG